MNGVLGKNYLYNKWIKLSLKSIVIKTQEVKVNSHSNFTKLSKTK